MGKSAGTALLGMKKSTHQMTFLHFEAVCGVQIKRLSPSECTEGAHLRATAPMTSAFSSGPRDHGLSLSLCIQSCPRAELSDKAVHRVARPQLSKYRCWEASEAARSLEPAWTRVSRCKRNNCFPEQGRRLQPQQCLNTNSLFTWQRTSLRSWSKVPATGRAPRCLERGFRAPPWVAYLVLCRSWCRMLLLGDVLSQTPADPLLLLLGVSLQT